MTCRFSPDATGKKYFADASGGAAVFSNPMQSPLYKNCHLITALSSLAWINNKFFSVQGNPCLYTFYDFDPYTTLRGQDKGQYPPGKDLTKVPVEVPVSVNTNIFMDNATGIWCGATSKNPEYWPAMYEKAFGKFCMFKFPRNIIWNDLNNPAIDPDFSTLSRGSDWGGNPVTVLRYLTGRGLKPYTYTTNKSFNLSSDAVYKYIKSLCVTTPMGRPSDYGTVNGAKVQYPAGAWTYIDANDAKTKANVTIAYDDSSMVGDHCYSILGIYEDGGSQYIVLRNPYGQVDADPAKYTSGKGPWIYFEKRYAIGGIVAADAAGKIVSFPFSSMDGIFALDVKVFTQYFEGLGHIST